MRRRFKSKLNRLNKIKNEQRKNNRTFELTKEIRTSILIKENETLDKKKRNRLRHNSKETRTEIIVSNIYEIRKTTIYKRLSRRFTS